MINKIQEIKRDLSTSRIPSSFRDPSGFVFVNSGRLYRQINAVYKEDYTHLMDSGLYKALVDTDRLIPHREVPTDLCEDDSAYKVIAPERINFISYPYEWCFSELKDAALLTLAIQKCAMQHGMTLKDSSAYNIQFNNGKPLLIDTLSFERYVDGTPWVAYRQFCQHFLVPLALMSYTDIRLGRLLEMNLDGLPLDLGSRLLPWRSRFRPALLMHIHMHAKSQKRYGAALTQSPPRKLSRFRFLALLDNLEASILSLQLRIRHTEWSDYYGNTNYTNAAFEYKRQCVHGLIKRVRPNTVWDLGANTGVFSLIAARCGASTIAFDIDPLAVDMNYRKLRSSGETRILPLHLDLLNPSPSTGWHHKERMSTLDRGPADLILALALIHHLAIANNLPLCTIAQFFATAGRWLVVEFIPKSDSQVRRLLVTRKDIFDQYTKTHFEISFMKYFQIEQCHPVEDSDRVLYLMRSRIQR